MYLEFFGLQEKPFGLTPDPKFLFLSRQHREALDHLLYGIQQKEGFVVISGDIGTGKTTLCRALLERLDAQSVTSALILNPLLAEEELLRAVLEEFGLPGTGASRKELLDELNHFLLETAAVGKTAVLIIDEAQNLTASCLEQVRLLSNLETDKEKLIQIILVGSEELQAKLALPELSHLQQRISVRYHLRPLPEKETSTYIQHRLAMAGAAGGVAFDKKAYREIYRFSGGVPRLINMIADRALLAACLAGSEKVNRGHVVRGRESLRGETVEERPWARIWLQKRFHPALLALFLLTVAVALVLLPGVRQSLERHYLEKSSPASVAPLRPAPGLDRPQSGSIGQTAGSGPGDKEPGVRVQTGAMQKPAQAEAKAQGPAAESGNAAGRQDRSPAVGPEKAVAATSATKGATETLPQYVYRPPYIYTVHVNSFKRKQDALARARELQSRGFDAWVAWVDLGDRGIWYRVLLGRYRAKKEAVAMVRQLHRKKEFYDARQIAANAKILANPAGAPP